MTIIKRLRDEGYSDTAVSAIMGNIDVETGGSFSHTQQQEGFHNNNSRSSFGYDDSRPKKREDRSRRAASGLGGMCRGPRRRRGSFF